MSPLDPSRSTWSNLLVRLGLALVSGALIGWERHASGKPAGLRTHTLVSVGAAMFVMAALESSEDSASRVAQGIAAGIGFLGAGEIFQFAQRSGDSGDRPRVIGLTSAAAIWVSGALGVSAGYGLWRLVVVGSAITLLILTLAKRVEGRISTGDDGSGTA
ncbi:MgtC/SapB family protein [Sorangium sp. So ce136]|uniref:MgtC/SapB family protein n=1 Tax=Sorangium sp. So ce136 TaxID=3133284 RepID=UPI003F0486D8